MRPSWNVVAAMPEEVRKVLRDYCWSLRNRIREAEELSFPCPPGHWRWADLDISGYRRKTEEELAADRDRNAIRAARLRGELVIIEAYLRKEGASA